MRLRSLARTAIRLVTRILYSFRTPCGEPYSGRARSAQKPTTPNQPRALWNIKGSALAGVPTTHACVVGWLGWFALAAAISAVWLAPTLGAGQSSTTATKTAKTPAPPEPDDPAAKRGPVPPKLAEPAKAGWTPPRTPWSDPDLQGIWPSTDMVGVPMQRGKEFGERNLLTDAEFAARQAASAKQIENDNAEFDIDHVPAEVVALGTVGGPVSPPPHWLERGKASRQASLVVDPPDGRAPALTSEAQQRGTARQEARRDRGPADSWEDRSLYDRCITRGLIGTMLPVIYNNGNEILQTPGQVVIRLEMIHETRIIPLDGRPRTGIRQFLGEPRGRWDGNTLVVETTNFTDRTGIGANGGGQQHSEALRVVERFTRTDADTLQYEVTIDDPKTYVKPWKMAFPLKRDPNYGMFEYACHEGNYALRNILSGARADEQAALKGIKPQGR